MPLIAFVDKELDRELEKIKNDNTTEEIFPEHQFIATCQKVGFTVTELKQMSYIDVMKILLCHVLSNKEEKTNTRKATQSDIDKLLG